MKKYLVFSAFIVLFAPSFAVAEETEYTISGEWDSFYGYTFPNHKYKHRDKRDTFVNTFNVEIGAEKSFNNDYSLGIYADLMAAVNKRQRNYSNGLWGHELYAIFDNPYGRLMIGETTNVAAQFHVSAPKAGKFGVNDSDIVNFISNPNWIKSKHQTAFRTLNSTDINTDGTAPKISYILPDMNGLIVGFSYIPDTDSRTGLMNRDACYAKKDGYVAAAYYSTDLTFAELQTSAGFAVFNEKDRDMSFGLSLYRSGWTIGGGWRKTYIDGTENKFQTISNDSRLPYLFDNYREGQAWNAGIGYEFGPFKTALSYFENKAENTKNKDKIWLWSNEFQYNKNLSVYLAGAKAEFRGENEQESNQGYSAITGFSVKF